MPRKGRGCRGRPTSSGLTSQPLAWAQAVQLRRDAGPSSANGRDVEAFAVAGCGTLPLDGLPGHPAGPATYQIVIASAYGDCLARQLAASPQEVMRSTVRGSLLVGLR
jgi:hypothetical protein